MSQTYIKVKAVVKGDVMNNNSEYQIKFARLKKSGNILAITVKIADLTNNSDYTRFGVNRP